MSVSPAKGRIVVVTAGGPNPQIMINALQARFGTVAVLREQPESRSAFLKRRIRKLGLVQTAGQFVTMTLSKFGKRLTAKRAAEIIRAYGVSLSEDPSIPVTDVASINEPASLAAVLALEPDVVFLISCRMLTARTLAGIPCPVINFHAGINPQYRGLMGGYWALAMGDRENFGATLHLVDSGVDTGDVLYQSRMAPSRNDTMHTYPLLQTAASTSMAISAVEDALAGRLEPVRPSGPSRQWYHPPVWTWVWNGLTKGVW